MNSILADLRFSLRTLRKSPLFTTIAVLSLALGIGANTAIFTFVDQLLLRLLPVKDPSQLAVMFQQGEHYGSNRGYHVISYPMYRDIREKNQVFTGVLGRRRAGVSLGFGGRTDLAHIDLVSGNFFDVLGVKAALGRTLTPDDDRTPGAHPVVVLGYSFWQNRFHGDRSVIGQTIRLNGLPMTIIGVSEQGFDGAEPGNHLEMAVPLMMKKQMTPEWDDLTDRRSRWVQVIGRLKPGVSLEQAKASLQPLHHQMLEMEVREAAFAKASQYTKDQFLKMTMNVLPAGQGDTGMHQAIAAPMYMLMAIVGLVLLIACANVANLLLARAANRQKEVAVRLSLGASRWQLIRQFLVESLMLSLAGGAAGIVVSIWVARGLLRFIPQESTDPLINTTPDARILLFTFALSIVTGILFGLAPAWQTTNPDVAPTLKDQAGNVMGGGNVMLRKSLVTAQVALSLLLLIGAGLFARSLQNLRNLDSGMKLEQLVAFDVNPSLAGYDAARTRAFYQQLLERLGSNPGVSGTALADVRVLARNDWESTVTVEGYEAKPGEDMAPWFNGVSPGYFNALGIPLLAGRDFTAKDDLAASKVAVVNQSFVKKFFDEKNPIGRHLGLGGDPGTKTDIEIIGVVRDTNYDELRKAPPRQVFIAALQSKNMGGMTVFAKTVGDPLAMASTIRREVAGLDSNVPVYQLKTMTRQLDESLVLERFVSTLSSAFGILATVLAVIGLYGVMAYTVVRRSREIGVRIALGARSSQVVRLIMREVSLLVGIGVAIALPASYGLTRLIRSLLYGVEPFDPLTMATATLLLGGVALFAGFLPAWRASKVDPVRILRYE